MNKNAADHLFSHFLAWRSQGWKGDYLPHLKQAPQLLALHSPELCDYVSERGVEIPQIAEARKVIARPDITIVTCSTNPHRFAQTVVETASPGLKELFDRGRDAIIAESHRKLSKLRARATSADYDVRARQATADLERRLRRYDKNDELSLLEILLPVDSAIYHFKRDIREEEWCISSGATYNRFKSYWQYDLSAEATINPEPKTRHAVIIVFPYSPDIWQLANCVRQLRAGATVFINNAVPPMPGTFPDYTNHGKIRPEFLTTVNALSGLRPIAPGSCADESALNQISQLLPFEGRIICNDEHVAVSIAKKIRDTTRGQNFTFMRGDDVLLVRKDPSIYFHLAAGQVGKYLFSVADIAHVSFGKSIKKLPLGTCKIVHSYALFREWTVGVKPGAEEWAILGSADLGRTLAALGFNVRCFAPVSSKHLKSLQ